MRKIGWRLGTRVDDPDLEVDTGGPPPGIMAVGSHPTRRPDGSEIHAVHDVLASNRSKYVDAGCPDTIIAAELDSVRGDVPERSR